MIKVAVPLSTLEHLRVAYVDFVKERNPGSLDRDNLEAAVEGVLEDVGFLEEARQAIQVDWERRKVGR